MQPRALGPRARRGDQSALPGPGDHASALRAREYTTRFIDETPELFRYPRKRDRATRLLRFIGEVIVNGHPEVKEGRAVGAARAACAAAAAGEPPPGTRQRLDELGPAGFAQWMLEHELCCSPTRRLRDAHQSLLATRFRTRDMAGAAPHYARLLPELFSVECWGGATFDVALRFLGSVHGSG